MEHLGPIEGSPLLPPAILTWYFIIFTLVLVAVYVALHQHVRPVHIRRKIILFLFSAIVIKSFFVLGAGLLTAYWLIPTPHITSTVPISGTKSHSPNEKIEIIFDRPVSRRSIEKTITPDVPGVWVFENSIYTTHLYRRLVFYPTVSLKPDTDYTISLSNIKNALKISKPYSNTISFKTQQTPEILSISPKNDSKDIDILSNITIELTSPNDRLSEFDFIISPSISYQTILSPGKKIYTLKLNEKLEQGTIYHLEIRKSDTSWNLEGNTVVQRHPTLNLYHGAFVTKQQPGIEQFTPSESSVEVLSPIKILFSDRMDIKSVEDNFSIEPRIEGEFKWDNNKSVEFSHPNFSFGTTYKITIKNGAATTGSGFIEKDIVKTFTTIGAVEVQSFSPSPGWSNVAVSSPVKFTFDQAVDKTSAENSFSISPNVEGQFRWDNNTLMFYPSSNFSFSTVYVVKLASGIKSVNGLPSDTEFVNTFATQEQTVKLAVPIYLQQHALSCEVAALRMALAFRGVLVSEEVLLDQVGWDKTSHNGNIWGDPYKAFVGNVDGRQMVDGYGVYWDPITKAAKNYRGAYSFQKWPVELLTQAIADGNPVVIWVYSKYGSPTSWKTPEGKDIMAVRDEHAVTVVGFVGPSSNPSQIIVNDPLIGQIYWPKALFDKKWNIFERSGTVIN